MNRRYVRKPVPGEKDAQGAYLPPKKDAPPEPFLLSKFLFDKQLKFVNDPRPFKLAVCSRRAGKTVSCAAHLIDTALKTPEAICLYITLSRTNAKKLVWREMVKINNTHKLGGLEDQTELSLAFKNGSIIYLSGAKDASEIEKFRGIPIKLVYIDECQSFREYIRDLIEDVLDAALMDYDGTLCMIGTPSAIPAGFFAECAGVVPGKEHQTNAWSTHHWTFFDNPHIALKSGKPHQHALDRVLKRRGVTVDDPSIQREFYGRWVHDVESLWVRYHSDKCNFDYLPDNKNKEWKYIMGIDLGFNDADAIAILAWSQGSSDTYLVDELVTPKQGLTELVEQIHTLQKKYGCYKMVIDEGGLGKKLAEEMRRRHKLPVQAADKARKQETVAFLNDALRTGRFKAKTDSKFAQDSRLVEVDKDKSRPDKIAVSDKYHSDIIDAVIYAFKESPAFSYQAPLKGPQPGTKEWAEALQDSLWDAAQNHFSEEAEQARKFGQD